MGSVVAVGLLLVVAGTASLVAKAWFNIVPTAMGTIPILVGGALIGLAWFLEQIVFPPWVWFLILMTLLIGVGGPSLYSNWRDALKQKKAVPKT